jgi:hypothetical protein
MRRKNKLTPGNVQHLQQKPYSIVSRTRTSLFRPSRKSYKRLLSFPSSYSRSAFSPRRNKVCRPVYILSSSISNNHLRNTLPTQRLTRRKLLLLEPRERIESRSNKQHNRSRDQARRVADQREELDDAHGEVDGGAHVICLEAADEGVEVLGGWADAEEEGDFDED